MTETREPAPPSFPAITALEPGVRAARLRAGLTQLEVADLLNVALDTYRRWDRGTARPRSPQRQQHLAVVLETPLDVLFPIEEDPHVAVALSQMEPRPERLTGTAAAETEGVEASPADPSLDLLEPVPASATGMPAATQRDGRGESENTSQPEWDFGRDDAPDWPAPSLSGDPATPHAVSASSPGFTAALPSPQEVLRTVDDGALFRPIRLQLRSARRAVSLAGVAAALFVVLWLAPGVAPGGHGGHPPASLPVDLTAGLRSTLTATVDATLNAAAESQKRAQRGADRLVRSASGAAERGEIELALARLDRVRTTYGMTPDARDVRRRVSVIRERRAERAVARRAEEKKRAVAAARRQPPAASGGATVASVPDTGSASGSSGSSAASSGTASSNAGAASQTSQSNQRPKSTSSEPARDPGLF